MAPSARDITNLSRRILRGVVTKAGKMDKTATVSIERIIEHPITYKRITRHTKLLTHDPTNVLQEGQRVLIKECRPLSRHKHHILHQIQTILPGQAHPTSEELKLPPAGREAKPKPKVQPFKRGEPREEVKETA